MGRVRGAGANAGAGAGGRGGGGAGATGSLSSAVPNPYCEQIMRKEPIASLHQFIYQ